MSGGVGEIPRAVERTATAGMYVGDDIPPSLDVDPWRDLAAELRMGLRHYGAWRPLAVMLSVAELPVFC